MRHFVKKGIPKEIDKESNSLKSGDRVHKIQKLNNPWIRFRLCTTYL